MLGCFQLGKPNCLNSKENYLTKSRGKVDSGGSTMSSRSPSFFLAFRSKIGSPYGCKMTASITHAFPSTRARERERTKFPDLDYTLQSDWTSAPDPIASARGMPCPDWLRLNRISSEWNHYINHWERNESMNTMGEWRLDVQRQCLLQKDELDGFGEVFTVLGSLVGRLSQCLYM